jgi:hypothetical protein
MEKDEYFNISCSIATPALFYRHVSISNSLPRLKKNGRQPRQTVDIKKLYAFF